MPVNSESINRKLFDLLSVRGYDPKPLDVEGKVTPVPEEAAVIKFDFIKDGENYGKVWASIDGAKTLQLYYGDSVTNSPDDPSKNSEYDDTWTGLIKHLKNWAQRRQLGFDLKNENHLVSDMARRKHTESLSESILLNDEKPKLSGLSLTDLEKLSETAYNDYYEFNKNISKNLNLPKHRGVPSNTLNLYSVYRKQKISENKNKELTPGEEELFIKFNSRAKSTLDDVKAGDHVSVLSLSTLSIPNDKIFARLQGFLSPKEVESISRANNIDYLHFVDGSKFPDTDNDDPMYLAQSWTMTKLFESYDDASKAFMLYSVEGDETSKNIQFDIDVDTKQENVKESDISGLLSAARLNRSFIITAQTAEGQTKKYRVKAQSANVAKEKFMKHHSMAKILDVKEENIDESGLQAYLGNKKYGKAGMDALRKAGREGASKEKMAQIRAKYDKLDEEGVAEGQESMKQVNEGYYPMGKQGSYSDAIPTTKIILQHTRKIEEGEQRYRNVAKIFVENMNGERFLIPTTKPGIARVYARHIAEGGTPYDERGKHITSLVEEYQKMAGFVRATRNKQFNESAQKLVNEGVSHYQSLRETLHKMCGHRGYMAYFESYTPTLVEDGEEQKNLNELFVQETLDPRIESVMPILSRLHKKVSEMKEVGELAEWADSLEEAEEIQEENTPLRDKEDLMARRKALQDILSDPDTAKDPLLKREAMKRKHDLEKEAESKGLAEEMVDESSNVPMDVRALYAQTYAKFAKTAGAAKGAKQMAYAMVEKKYGKDMAEKLKAYHNSNLDEEMGEDMAEGFAGYQAYRRSKVGNTRRTGQSEREFTGEPGKYNKEGILIGKDGHPVIKTKAYKDWLKQQGGKKEQDMAEDLDANQKRAGQLGPTEKVGPKGAVGKLVGANESLELNEMDKSQKPPGRDGDDEDAGKKQIHLGPDSIIKAKDLAKDAKEKLEKSMDKAHKKEVKEGQEDLDAILRIIKK